MMRRIILGDSMRAILVIACCLLMSACWETGAPVITGGERVPGFADGTYRRPDGTELQIRWTGEAYAVGAGTARAEPLPGGKWLVDYSDAVRLVMVVEMLPDGFVVRMPTPEAGARVAKSFGIALKPAPVIVLSGPPDEIRAFATAIAQLDGTADLVEGERLVRVR